MDLFYMILMATALSANYSLLIARLSLNFYSIMYKQNYPNDSYNRKQIYEDMFEVAVVSITTVAIVYLYANDAVLVSPLTTAFLLLGASVIFTTSSAFRLSFRLGLVGGSSHA